MRLAALTTTLLLLTTPALAELHVRFDEGAPKDRFTVTNVGACDLGASAVTIDLSGSPYGLIFDVTGKGAGVQVFQPFELTSGAANLTALPQVSDGDNQVTLNLRKFPSGASVSFTIDVDDTVNSREITVSNTEIAGAAVIARTGSQMARGTFGENAKAEVKLASCAS